MPLRLTADADDRLNIRDFCALESNDELAAGKNPLDEEKWSGMVSSLLMMMDRLNANRSSCNFNNSLCVHV